MAPYSSRRTLLRAWLYNFIIGNADAHAKNYSFLWHAKTGRWTVAPLYDLLSVTHYLASQPQSMGLLDEYRPGWFGPEHWRELARLAGVTPAYLAGEACQMAAAVRKAAPSLAVVLRDQLLPDELDFLAEKINPAVQQRCEQLLDARIASRG
ncbi:MAG: HipA domain-containing protein [Burkholderiales bacterium]